MMNPCSRAVNLRKMEDGLEQSGWQDLKLQLTSAHAGAGNRK
ncbi:hypothetical protein [Paenibacillus sp. QZ-Y1]